MRNYFQKLFFSIISPLLLLVLSGLILMPIYALDGWPGNHEGDTFFQRTLIYSQHLLLGDWLPIWSSLDNYGFGSPFPAYYHKLFYIVSGTIFALTGMMKYSILLSLYIWFLVGGLGMYMLCRQLKCRKAISWSGAMMFLMANYTTTNWLIRGAMAELAAAMLIPWLLSVFVYWLTPAGQSLKNYVLLGLFLGLIFLSHSVIAYYLVIVLGASYGLQVIFRGTLWTKVNLRYCLASLSVFGCVVGPYLLAMHFFRQISDTSRLIIPPFLPEYSIRPFVSYFWDPDWSWGANYSSITVQLDIPVLLLFFSGIAWILGPWAYCRFTDRITIPIADLGVGFFVLLICVYILFILQTPLALPFYRFFPGAAYLQFSWRLLGILTPLLIVLSLRLWSIDSEFKKIGNFCIGVCFIGMLYLCGAWAPLKYEIMLDKEVSLKNLSLGWNGSYMPPQVRLRDPAPPKNLFEVYVFLDENDSQTLASLRNQYAQYLKEIGCAISSDNAGIKETLVQEYLLSCKVAGEIPLPVFASQLHRVSAFDINTKQASYSKCSVADNFPGLCVLRIKGSGTYRVYVATPTFIDLIKNLNN